MYLSTKKAIQTPPSLTKGLWLLLQDVFWFENWTEAHREERAGKGSIKEFGKFLDFFQVDSSMNLDIAVKTCPIKSKFSILLQCKWTLNIVHWTLHQIVISLLRLFDFYLCTSRGDILFYNKMTWLIFRGHPESMGSYRCSKCFLTTSSMKTVVGHCKVRNGWGMIE